MTLVPALIGITIIAIQMYRDVLGRSDTELRGLETKQSADLTFESQIVEVKEENARLRATAEQLMNAHQTLQEENAELRAKLSNIENQATTLERDVADARLEMSQTKATMRVVEDQLAAEQRRPMINIEPEVTLPERKPKMSADLVIKSVSIASTKENGDPWDAGQGRPDPMVRVEKSGLLFGSDDKTGVEKDTYYATFNYKSLRLEEGDKITISVYDEDFADRDLVGEYTKEITASTLQARTFDWPFGQVKSLVVEFEP